MTVENPWGQIPSAEPFGDGGDFDEPNKDGLWFASVEEFVNDYLAAIIHRRLGQGTAMWCPSWWLHPEAVVRFSAMWRAFEYLTRDPDLGMSTWWLHHADPHLRLLTDPDQGPFALCDPWEGHASTPLPGLPVHAAPPGTWDNPAFRVAPTESPDRSAP